VTLVGSSRGPENTLYQCQCNERLKAKTEGSTRLVYNGSFGGLEHLKIQTRLRGERFENVKGECTIWKI
jgi:hypothetical protein